MPQHIDTIPTAPTTNGGGKRPKCVKVVAKSAIVQPTTPAVLSIWRAACSIIREMQRTYGLRFDVDK
jgi:hypothetical protein